MENKMQAPWDEKNACTDWLDGELFDQYIECDRKFLGFRDKVPYSGTITNNAIYVNRTSPFQMPDSFISAIKEIFDGSGLDIQIESLSVNGIVIKAFFKEDYA